MYLDHQEHTSILSVVIPLFEAHNVCHARICLSERFGKAGSNHNPSSLYLGFFCFDEVSAFLPLTSMNLVRQLEFRIIFELKMQNLVQGTQ